ncbi:MAG: tyrosine-type recombinase/integrase [Ferrimicrobium sp.]
MENQSHVHITGPLETYAAGFEQELIRQGYRCPKNKLYLMAWLSLWLSVQELGIGDVTETLLAKFLRNRNATRCGTNLLSVAKLQPLLNYLRNLGVIPLVEVTPPVTPIELFIEGYRNYLDQERGFAPGTVRNYLGVAHAFVTHISTNGSFDLATLSAAQVSDFILAESRRGKVGSVKSTTTRLRSLLRYAYLEGLTQNALAGAVPSVACWRLSSLPKAMPTKDVAKLVKSCDHREAVGRRDFAILMLLWRLGLRAGEVARLELGDIDWRSGEVVIRGKGNRNDKLPLPSDVGEAIVNWLQQGRPQCSDAAVFVRVHAPIGRLSPGGITSVVRNGCKRAAVPLAGAHRLRHSAATEMLRSGSNLIEVGQVLRHRDRSTTAIYAKIDHRSLSEVVQPWPGGTS